ncbi:LPS biosynthesis-modulating metalloenzyme YejM [Serratia microhaemolytica]|uniref:LPS biosynthesis-modulating metalloenzyme YejM n=1 Tax=Serratia microhaemolytica TaxID=2675110 RepID=UPI000FDDB019|nr:LPS biosynthesis-modulating metalloenzyme YejM [Serratia microhaemolytica]
MVTNAQNYREKVSQMISWGHWFALFNILLSIALASRYLLVSDWPGSLLGRIYAFVSLIGHFSFIVFAGYLLIIFPLTFVVMRQQLLRVLSALLATAGLTLLLIDSEVFSLFHLHLNPMVWELLINPEQSERIRQLQLMFIVAPLIFLVEMLFATWSWQKLRSLNRRKFAKPLAVLFICCFVTSHLLYLWADANFYRPITMQRANLPLSYPMTARKFLEKYGLLDAQEYQRRLMQQGDPAATSIEYPLSKLTYVDKGSGYNLLMVVVRGINPDDIAKNMPVLHQFAQDNIRFDAHYSAGLISLFYGISPTYLDSVLAGRKSSALINALSDQGYQFGLFSSDGFKATLYRQALLADFSLPKESLVQSDADTTRQWQNWLALQHHESPWFSYLYLTGNNAPKAKAKQGVDAQLAQILATLQQQQLLEKTVVVITAEHDLSTANDKEKGRDGFHRYQSRVPLVIHWPGTPAQSINKLTSHPDVMRTLMQRLLHVKTSASDYSQGEDLFAAQRRNNWIVSGNDHQLVITTPTQTLVLDSSGKYSVYDHNGEELLEQKPQLTLLLQVLTDIKRFIAN